VGSYERTATNLFSSFFSGFSSSGNLSTSISRYNDWSSILKDALMLSFQDARRVVIQKTTPHVISHPRNVAEKNLSDALGDALAQEIRSDRDYPPFDRSTRDGYAARASDAVKGATLRCVGEIKAGDTVTEPVSPGTCIQIMTGAAVPAGADAVVMIEFTDRAGENITFQRATNSGQNIVKKGSEARSGDSALKPGVRLGFAELALAAQIGAAELLCARRPRVAILSTGDEIVPITEKPGPFHIRNSNSVSLAAQVRLAGGEPVPLGNALDRVDDLGAKIELGLKEDILVLSGGVSMGKYDLVETVLKSLGAEFYFDAVAIRPGKPAVFGCCRDTFVFGLPGNPVSTMVTFQLFVTPAIDVLGGARPRPLPLLEANLTKTLHEKPGLAHFLPAHFEWTGISPEVQPLTWQGSGDIAALTHANCFIVVPADRQDIPAGEKVSVLPRLDVI
jgi:molybdopterin molybdotransferase